MKEIFLVNEPELIMVEIPSSKKLSSIAYNENNDNDERFDGKLK